MFMSKFRLIKDGSIVGYETHKPSRAKDIMITHSKNGINWGNIWIKKFFIPHDVKDWYFGKGDNQEELYENDIVEISYDDGMQESTIDWKWGGFFVDTDKIKSDWILIY